RALPRPIDSGLDVPPNRHDIQLDVLFSSPVDHLHRPPRSSGTDSGAVGQIIESPPYEHISGVLTRRDRDDLQIVCERGRQVLQGVHRDINLISAQRIAYRADKDPSATDLGELALIKITSRRNAYKGRVAARRCTRGAFLVGLCAGEQI